VTSSLVTAYNALGNPGSTVGNGTYSSGGFVGSLGVRGHLGSSN
jgi:hypothetical protein